MNDRFTTRVLLHDADDDDYETLHEAMEDEGFTRTLEGNDGIEYHLPQAEYNRIGNLTGEDVRSAAVRAAKTTGKKHAVLVTPSSGRYWTGLDKVI